MPELSNLIYDLVSRDFEEIRTIRRYLHQHPELSKEEHETADYICQKLDQYGISYQKGIAGNGIVGLIEGKNPKKRCVALRADMDALPVKEENKTDYVSREPGKMHACGHDVHMTCLLGAARILSELKEQFEGTVKLLFQPSEETYPGGAIAMIDEGILENPDVQVVIGQHVTPNLDAGKAGFNPGPDMASTDEIFLTVKGKGGHAAIPNFVVDPVVIAAHIILALQQIVSRHAEPTLPTVISFGRIVGEGRTNIIPDEVKIDGTVRTYDETWRKEIHRKIETIASSIAVSMGGGCEVKISSGYPYLHNEEQLTTQLQHLAGEYLGEGNVVNLERRMTAEDFAYFAQRVPSCLYRLGIRNEAKGIDSGLHSSTFDIDETALETGTGLLAWFAINLLNDK
ncbi:MAG: amidohydrolase [Bacteroidales bacterium]|nr:amidohydrolase [Bacteroidota bacterium]MBL6949479.1 amidohydrolase [Bacteroidales bacterium]